MKAHSILIGDGIENPCNAEALRAVAAMFAWDCGFWERDQTESLAPGSSLIALENTADAENLYGFHPPPPPPGARVALIVGNERRGISREVLARAHRTIRIPMASQQINTVNVAAAAAIALYFLSRGSKGRMRTRPAPGRSRPEILIADPGDPVELGSTVRSAAAFGWGRIFVADRGGVWFGRDRVTRSLGRGAARRGRNGIHVLPAANCTGGFAEACILTTCGDGEPIERVDLAGGPEQLILLPDESGGPPDLRELSRLARKTRPVRLELPQTAFPYKLRLIASIVLAEITRQVGMRQRPRTAAPVVRADAQQRGGQYEYEC